MIFFWITHFFQDTLYTYCLLVWISIVVCKKAECAQYIGVSCLSDRCTCPTLQRGSPQEKKESEKMDDKEEEVMVAEEHIKEN